MLITLRSERVNQRNRPFSYLDQNTVQWMHEYGEVVLGTLAFEETSSNLVILAELFVPPEHCLPQLILLSFHTLLFFVQQDWQLVGFGNRQPVTIGR